VGHAEVQHDQIYFAFFKAEYNKPFNVDSNNTSTEQEYVKNITYAFNSKLNSTLQKVTLVPKASAEHVAAELNVVFMQHYSNAAKNKHVFQCYRMANGKLRLHQQIQHKDVTQNYFLDQDNSMVGNY